MTIFKIAQIGHPALRDKARWITEDPHELGAAVALLDDLTQTMREYGGVGLAAPQVRVRIRAFVVEVAASERYPDRGLQPLLRVINPTVTALTEEREVGWEGCLSIAGLLGRVPRFKAVSLEGLDARGEPMRMELEGFAAIVVQHEYDHLEGIVFLDRMPDMSSLMAEEEYRRMQEREREQRDAIGEAGGAD